VKFWGKKPEPFRRNRGDVYEGAIEGKKEKRGVRNREGGGVKKWGEQKAERSPGRREETWDGQRGKVPRTLLLLWGDVEGEKSAQVKKWPKAAEKKSRKPKRERRSTQAIEGKVVFVKGRLEGGIEHL